MFTTYVSPIQHRLAATILSIRCPLSFLPSLAIHVRYVETIIAVGAGVDFHPIYFTCISNGTFSKCSTVPRETPFCLRVYNIAFLTQRVLTLFTHLDVSPEQFVRINEERERRSRRFRFRRYDSTSRTLIVTIPTALHEQLHVLLYEAYRDQVVERGMRRSWATLGSETLQAASQPGDSGEGDSTGGPDPERQGPGRWPTLVIEAGYSQSLAQLQAQMRWWFSVSNHNVKIVLLAKFDRRHDKIILQRWEEEGPPPRPGAVNLQPVLRQEITISRDTSTDPPSYKVARGVLVLEFRLLFLRDPGPQEGDFIIGMEELQRYAAVVWVFIALASQDKRPILIDFGSAHRTGDKLSTCRGTKGWIDCEIKDYTTPETRHDASAANSVMSPCHATADGGPINV
ncbi:hypothetical protein ACRALDRAFT_207148 [Sodiomyces alcalophilus JCM 7366]|uniref:uncharacterized protein n=1 Tax=Sodiomyces alcalophilus JCM 7366 TaxID=591952 RepID=UPI0039B60675